MYISPEAKMYLTQVGVSVALLTATAYSVVNRLTPPNPSYNKDRTSKVAAMPVYKAEPTSERAISIESTDTHHNLISTLLNQRGLDIFTPSLELQAQQGGGTLVEVERFNNPQLIPAQDLRHLQRRRPGPQIEIFEPFGVLDPSQVVQTSLRVGIRNNKTGELESYYLQADPCRVTEMPSTPQTRWILEILPTGLDRGDKILAAEPCWVIKREVNLALTPLTLTSQEKK